MSNLRKWKLLSKTDVSQSPYFPLEKRVYELPNGKIVDDFYITTLADSTCIIPITPNNKIIMIRMYKQGVDDFVIQFPFGRFEEKHKSIIRTAVLELEEETGIKVTDEQLIKLGTLALATTKATEKMHYYFVKNALVNSAQHLDPNEEIEVLVFTSDEIDQMISSGKFSCAPSIAGWYLLKSKFPELIN